MNALPQTQNLHFPQCNQNRSKEKGKDNSLDPSVVVLPTIIVGTQTSLHLSPTNSVLLFKYPTCSNCNTKIYQSN